jgi:hypothetical protein
MAGAGVGVKFDLLLLLPGLPEILLYKGSFQSSYFELCFNQNSALFSYDSFF